MFKNALLVIASILLTLVACAVLFEIAANVRYERWKAEFVEKRGLSDTIIIPSANEVLVWEYRPNTTGKMWGVHTKINNHGFRDANRAYRKHQDDLRIAFAGDSVTLGLGVEANDSFVRVFERDARTGTPPIKVEAMSFAVGGYSGIQVAEMLRSKVIPFSPDIVVYVMCMNDFDFTHASGQLMKYFRKPENFLMRFLERTYSKFFTDHYYIYHFQKNRAVVFAEIFKLKTEMDNHGIDFRVALMPIFEDENSLSTYSILAMHTEISTILTENEIPVIDFLHTFTNTNLPRTSFALDELHLNEAGHLIAANHLADELLR